VRAGKHCEPDIFQSRGNRGPVLEGDFVPVPCSTSAGTQTAHSGARSISGPESIIVIVLAYMTSKCPGRSLTGQVDPAALDDLVSLVLQFAGHGPHCGSPQHADPAAEPGQTAAEPGQPGATGPAGGPDATGPAGDAVPVGPRPPTPQALEMLRHAIIGKAVDLVSGPGGLASFLRTRQLGARLAGPSLPLDVGRSAEIRRAVILRDQHCRWADGYFL
jgi:hypothetical protein